MSKFQEGGLANATGSEPLASGLLQALTQSSITSPEAQAEAREILDRYEAGSGTEDQLMQQIQETAESSRAALRQARERLLARKRDPSEMWFRLAEALGRPTRTGAFGETLGFVGGAMADELQKRREFEQGRQTELLGLDQALSGIDQQMLQSQLALETARRRAEAGLAGKALSTLGKPTSSQIVGKDDPRRDAAKALDAAYLKEYIPFVTGGSADGAKGLQELSAAVKELRSGKDTLTGPVVGSISTLTIPYVGEVGKAIQDVMWPAGSNVREMVEITVQRSLKPILGSQFTAEEGKRLMERVYNPRLEEHIIAGRVERLLEQLKRAYKEKVRAAEYFQQNGTLTGFKGKVNWAIEDFEPDTNKADLKMMNVRMPDGSLVRAPEGSTQSQVIEIWKKEKEAKEKKARGGHIRGFQRGGEVTEDVTLDALPENKEEELGDLSTSTFEGPTVQDLIAGGVGAVVGGMAGKGGVDIAARLEAMVKGLETPTAGESQVLRALEVGDEEIGEIGAEVKRGRRQHVPRTLMDVGKPAMRALAEEGLTQGGKRAEEVIEDLGERHEGSRQRVAERVNRSLKPYPYFERMDKLTQDLYQNAAPLYKEAYEAHPGISLDEVPALRDIMQSPDGKRAIKLAIRLLRNEGKKVGKEDAVGLVRKPSLEYLDYVKRGFDQLISQEENLGPTTLGRSMRKLRTRLRNQLDDVSTKYEEARAQYAGDLEVLDALRSGREDFFRMQPEEVETFISQASPAEHRAYRTGVAQRIYEMVNSPSTDINAARRLIGSPALREKLRHLFKKKSEARVFETALEREMELFERSKRMGRRVESARQRRMSKELLEEPRGGRAAQAAQFVVSPIMGVARLFTQPKFNLTPEVADEVVDILNRGTPQEIDATIRRLAPLAKRRAKIKKTRSKAAAVGAFGGALLAPFLNEEIDTEE